MKDELGSYRGEEDTPPPPPVVENNDGLTWTEETPTVQATTINQPKPTMFLSLVEMQSKVIGLQDSIESLTKKTAELVDTVEKLKEKLANTGDVNESITTMKNIIEKYIGIRPE